MLFVIPSEARDLLFFATPKKQQIPRANPALRNDTLRVFPHPLLHVLLAKKFSGTPNEPLIRARER
jgi:hypothetical protein